jgi:hypothetical protein
MLRPSDLRVSTVEFPTECRSLVLLFDWWMRAVAPVPSPPIAPLFAPQAFILPSRVRQEPFAPFSMGEASEPYDERIIRGANTTARAAAQMSSKEGAARMPEELRERKPFRPDGPGKSRVVRSVARMHIFKTRAKLVLTGAL